jgi:hypothetical protein
MIRRLFTVAGVVALGAASAAAALPVPALAYTSTQACSTGSPSTTAAPAGVPITFKATFKGGTNCTGPDGPGTPVTYAQQGGPAGCTATFNPASSVTDANGNATTTVTLPPNCPGQYVLAASVADPATVTITLIETGALPSSTGPGGPAGTFPWTLVLLGAGIVLVAAGALARLARPYLTRPKA